MQINDWKDHQYPGKRDGVRPRKQHLFNFYDFGVSVLQFSQWKRNSFLYFCVDAKDTKKMLCMILISLLNTSNLPERYFTAACFTFILTRCACPTARSLLASG